MNIVITGVTSGLGKALVNQFQKDIKTNIIGIYRSKQKLSLSKKKIFLFKCDFSSEKDVKNLIKKIKKFGKIDCVINNHASLGNLDYNPKKLFFLNYCSIEYLILKIFKNIKKSKKKLVINISSHAHKNIAVEKKISKFQSALSCRMYQGPALFPQAAMGYPAAKKPRVCWVKKNKKHVQEQPEHSLRTAKIAKQNASRFQRHA